MKTTPTTPFLLICPYIVGLCIYTMLQIYGISPYSCGRPTWSDMTDMFVVIIIAIGLVVLDRRVAQRYEPWKLWLVEVSFSGAILYALIAII